MTGINGLLDGWESTTIGEIVSFEYGKGLRKDRRDETGKVPVYGSNGIVRYHSEALVKEPCLVVGRKGTAGAVHLSKVPCWPIDTTYYVIPPEGVSLGFLYHLLSSLQLEKLDKSTAIPGLNRNDAYAVEIALPPLPEQERIVAKIEETFTQLEAGIAELQNAKAQLKRFRAAVLKSAVEGELTREWREMHQGELEPAEKLLARILSERREKWEVEGGKGKYKEPVEPDFNEIGNVPDLPSSWVWVSLGQLAWSVKDGPHYSPEYAEEGIPFITGGNVRPSGVDFAKAKRITQELHEDLSRRVKPEKGDILYTKGGTTGIARVNTYDIDFNVWVHVAVLKLAQSINPFYLQHALNSPFCHSQAQKYTHGVGNQDLGLTRMIKIIISLPPLEEQQRIVEMIERRLSVADEIEKELDESLVRAERLRGSVLKSAFEGKL